MAIVLRLRYPLIKTELTFTQYSVTITRHWLGMHLNVKCLILSRYVHKTMPKHSNDPEYIVFGLIITIYNLKIIKGCFLYNIVLIFDWKLKHQRFNELMLSQHIAKFMTILLPITTQPQVKSHVSFNTSIPRGRIIFNIYVV